jgi:hypothetical protein
MAGCTPSIASQCTEIEVSRGALGKGASVTYIGWVYQVINGVKMEQKSNIFNQ